MAPPGINAFYYYAFTAIDPLLSLSAVYLNYFSPQTILDPAFPATSVHAKITPAVTFLQDQAGGAFAMFAFLMVFMLRQSDDLMVWKRFETGLLMTDFAALYSSWRAVQVLGGVWRQEAIANVCIIGVVTVVRLLFVAGVGVGAGAGKKGTARKRV
jgi:hypothetical protein